MEIIAVCKDRNKDILDSRASNDILNMQNVLFANIPQNKGFCRNK